MLKSKFRYFVCLANMRTGSNLLEQNLDLFDDITVHGELFNPSFIGSPKCDDYLDTTITERERDPLSLIGKLITTDHKQLPGFRLFSDHDDRVLDHCLADPECAKIILTRNPLDSFISLKIALTTGQWKLSDLRRRKEAKIEFKIDGFKSYLAKIEQFQARIRQQLQHSGQTGFHITYNDLADIEVINGLAKFLGSDQRIQTIKHNFKKQNSPSLNDKVENYDQALQQLRTIDYFATATSDFREPDQNPNVSKFIAASATPLLFLPLGGAGQEKAMNWMRSHDQENGATDLSLKTNMKFPELRQWLADSNDQRIFTVLTHPVERAYEGFYRYIFRTGTPGFFWMRNNLARFYQVTLPDAELCASPDRAELENMGYDLAAHRAAFEAFLYFLSGNLLGQTRMRAVNEWASQSAVLQGYARAALPDYIIRPQETDHIFALIEKQLNLKPASPLIGDETRPCFELSEIYDASIERSIRKIYARDYRNFGFSNWQEYP